MGISLQSFGAAGEVTGSKHLLTLPDGTRLLLDCGEFQGRRAEADAKNREFPFPPDKIDAVLLSHGHLDHCGSLPMLVKQGFDGPIHATPATRDIAGLIMRDAAHIMKKDYEWLLKKEKTKKAYPPLYDEDDVVRTLEQMETHGYRRPFEVVPGVTAEFFNSGHILGSAMIVLTVAQGGGEPLKLAFTGDVGRHGLPVISDPEPLPPVDYLICEGTYGNRLHEPMDDARQQLAEVIRETARKGGKVIIPAFAVGRTQELIYLLHLLKDEKAIPDLDIFVDSPMAVNATAIFEAHPECYDEETRQAFVVHHANPFGFNGLKYVTDVEESKAINTRLDPCIIISSSGMCEAGRILHHLKNNVGDPRNTVLIVGFMAQNTLGRALADKRPVVKIFGNPYPVRARVKILNTFSGHADWRDLTALVGAMDLQRLRQVFLVHGEADALESLRGRFQTAGVRAVTVSEPAHRYPLA